MRLTAEEEEEEEEEKEAAGRTGGRDAAGKRLSRGDRHARMHEHHHAGAVEALRRAAPLRRVVRDGDVEQVVRG